jgi:nucleoside-diphosphate-sugar epimerase
MAEFTVMGAGGFVGAALAARLAGEGRDVAAVGRGAALPAEAGHLVYCIGLTADFRTRPHETIEAHVSLVSRLLQEARFRSFTYLSSTRVYQRAASGEEEADLGVRPSDPSDLYNLSKLTGEAICLSDARPEVRVARLSNVYGPGDPSDNFLPSVLREAAKAGAVTIAAGRAAAKDYVAMDDVTLALTRMPERAVSRIINIASGTVTSNAEVGALIEARTPWRVRFGEDRPGPVFPAIATTRLREELGVTPVPFAQGFGGMLKAEAVGDRGRQTAGAEACGGPA